MRHLNLPLIAILLTTAAVYLLGFPGAFLLDDNINILPATISHLDLDELFVVISSNTSGPLGRPISVLSFALVNYFFSIDPLAHKLFNLCLHLAITVLGYQWIKIILKELGEPCERARLIALITIAFWALHPLQVSTVLYSVQRMTQLSSLFILLGLLSYAHFRAQLTHAKLSAFIGLVASFFVCWTAASFSKENGLLLPLFILLSELLIWRFKHTHPETLLTFLLLFIITPLCIALGYVIYQFDALTQGYAAFPFTLESRLLTQPHVLWFYCQLLIAPKLQLLSLFHDDFPIITVTNELFWTCLTAWIALVIIAFEARKYFPMLLWGISWFLAGHLLESTFLPLEMVFEHRNYLPSLGLIATFSTVIYSIGHRIKLSAYVGTALVLCTLIVLGGITAIRTHTWSNESLFLKVAAMKHPQSARAQGEWGNHLAMRGQIDAALAALDKSAQLAPNNPGPRLHQLLLSCSKPTVSELSIERSLVALAEKPMTPYAINTINNLLLAKLAKGCPSLTPDTIVMLAENAYNNPVTQAHPNWASLLGINLARAYFVNQQFNKAWDSYDKAYLFYPSRLETLIEKATMQASIADFASASKTLQDIEELTKNRLIRYDAQLEDLKRLINES